MKKVVILIMFSMLILSSCGVSNKTILRYQKLEEGVQNPTTVDELKDAINKYSERATDVQLANSKVGIWYKILGTKYIEQKMYGEALKAFQNALQYYPYNQNLYFYVGLCAGYMSKSSLDFDAIGKNDQKYNYLKLAESAYLQAIKIEPTYVRALYGLGVLYVFELDEAQKAIPHLEKLLTVDKKNIDAMMVLATAYYMNYEFDKSIEMYDKIILTSKSAETRAIAQGNKQQVLNVQFSK